MTASKKNWTMNSAGLTPTWKTRGCGPWWWTCATTPAGWSVQLNTCVVRFCPGAPLLPPSDTGGNKERQIRVRGRQIVFVPVVVLVNEHTASSSEITSGALKDHGVAIIIGTRTRGKGSVQRTWRLSEGSGIKLTIEKIYTPKGFSINKNGIIPDVEAGSPPGFNFDGKDPQLKKALNYLKSKGIR